MFEKLRLAALFLMIAAFVPVVSFAAEPQGPRSKKLEVTAVGLEWLAKKKHKMAEAETDPEKKKRLLIEIREIERLTDETFQKSKEEAVFEQTPAVMHARLDEQKAIVEVQKAQEAVDHVKEILQNPPEISQRAHVQAAEDFMKKMGELEAQKKTLESFTHAREAAEREAKEAALPKRS